MWTENDFFLIATAVGGTNNIVGITSCFTRVRIQVLDLQKVASDSLKTVPLVKGILVRGDEVQLVVGFESSHLATLCNQYLGKINPA